MILKVRLRKKNQNNDFVGKVCIDLKNVEAVEVHSDFSYIVYTSGGHVFNIYDTDKKAEDFISSWENAKYKINLGDY